MGDTDPRFSARAWARVARAAAQAHAPASRSAEASRELFDALEHAATVARLDLRELVDAYLAGVPELDLHEAWTEIEEYLERIADLQGLQLHRVVALPEWRERLTVRIAAHDLVLAAHRVLGDQDEQIERTRLAVVEVLDAAGAAGATKDELDAFLLQLRSEQCDLVSVVAAAAWVSGERARAHPVGLPAPAWATIEEIARDRGAPVDVVQALVSKALQRRLLASEPGRGVTVTAAGHAYNARATAA